MKIAVLPGDGIGPEVTKAAVSVLTDVADMLGIAVETAEYDIGGTAIRNFGSPFPEETATACLESDSVILGAVGDPAFDHLKPIERPEMGLLRLRKTLGGFANLRPARAYRALIDSSPLRKEIFDGTDLLIVRELLGGLYFGEPRGSSGNEAYNTMRYTTAEVERVARVAFEAAGVRRGKVTSVDKANVLETSQLWRSTVDDIAKDYPKIKLEHLFVDACAMRLVTDPKIFDVVLTENMFGDILSDEAAVLTGSLGMLASATIGSKIDLFEPVHGSAPDIAGKNIANPLGAIASVAMLFRYSAKNESAAKAIEDAMDSALDAGFRTADIAPKGSQTVSTDEMTDIIRRYAVDNAGRSRAYHAV
jgi:3-isopropylmalate dehydrogenase